MYILRYSFIILISLVYVYSISSAQTPTWTLKAGGTNIDQLDQLVVDANGATYGLGRWRGTADIFGSSISSSGGTNDDIFLVKINSSGQVLWRLTRGNTNAEIPRALVLHQTGVLIAGDYSGILPRGSGNLLNSGSTDSFLIKINGDGSIARATKAGGTAADTLWTIGVDSNDAIYAGGSFTNSGTRIFNLPLPSAGGTEGFVVKLSSTGVALTGFKIGNTSNEIIRSLSVGGAGELTIAGSFTNSQTILGSALVSSGSTESFVAHLSASLAPLRVRRVGSSGADTVTQVIATPTSVIIGGEYANILNIPGGGILANSGGNDVYLISRDKSTGTPLRTSKGGGTGNETLTTIAPASAGIRVAGTYNNTSNLFGSVLPTSGGTEGYAIQLNSSNGTMLTPLKVGTAGAESVNSLRTDAAGNLYLAGGFQNTMNLRGIATIVSSGNTDARIHKKDFVKPVGTITYTPATATNTPVSAILSLSEPATITSTGGVSAVIFSGNGQYLFTFVDPSGNTGEALATVTWIDTQGPTGSVAYTPATTTNGSVTATWTRSEPVTPINLSGLSYTFTSNGSYTLYVRDAAGNISSGEAIVTRIDTTSPTASLSYSPSSATSGSVSVTLTGSEVVTILNNSGSDTYTFTGNGSFVFQYQDTAGNTGSSTATVSWIDQTAPTATVSYSTTGTTTSPVTATITPSESVTITNNSSSNTIVFTGNGSFVFEFVDSVGYTGSITATVNRITIPTPPVVPTPSGGGGGGGGGVTLSMDYCPQGDTSPSYYDQLCAPGVPAGYGSQMITQCQPTNQPGSKQSTDTTHDLAACTALSKPQSSIKLSDRQLLKLYPIVLRLSLLSPTKRLAVLQRLDTKQHPMIQFAYRHLYEQYCVSQQ